MSSRMNAIVKLVRATFMQPEYLDLLIDTFAKQAAILNKKMKSGADLASEKERVRSEEFIKQFAPFFDGLSIEEMNYLADFFNSETAKKYHKMSLGLGSFTKTVQEAFLSNSESS